MHSLSTLLQFWFLIYVSEYINYRELLCGSLFGQSLFSFHTEVEEIFIRIKRDHMDEK